MKELLLYTLACFGLAYIIGYSKISLPFRVLLEPENDRQVFRAWSLRLIECPACLGFHFGWAFAVATGHTFGFPLQGWPAVVGLALYTCGVNFILAQLLLEGSAHDEAR